MSVAYWAGYPKSYSRGRSRPIQYIVVHITVGPEGPNSAENGVAYDKVRTDGTSTHVFVDSNTVAREVPDGDRAHTARYHGNEIGLQMEICGYIQTAAQWADATSQATLRLAARMAAEWCRLHGIPVRRLSVNEVRAAYYNSSGSRPKGFCGHIDVTQAYPEDNGSHTDPGAEFPWTQFLQMVQQELGGNMPKIIRIDEPIEDIPTEALYATGGSGFYWLSDAVAYANFWGLPNPFGAGGYTIFPTKAAAEIGGCGPFLGKYNQLAAGPKGNDGIDGIDGEDGEDGQPGPPGLGFAPGQVVTITGPVVVSEPE